MGAFSNNGDGFYWYACNSEIKDDLAALQLEIRLVKAELYVVVYIGERAWLDAELGIGVGAEYNFLQRRYDMTFPVAQLDKAQDIPGVDGRNLCAFLGVES